MKKFSMVLPALALVLALAACGKKAPAQSAEAQIAQAAQQAASGGTAQTAQSYYDGAEYTAQSEDDFDVTQNSDNTITITGYKGSAKDVVIPGTLYGLRVTAIGREAFQDKGLTSVVFPNTIVTIGYSAFSSESYRRPTNKLTEVVIPNSVTVIEDGAFSDSGITRLRLGTGVQTIGYIAFGGNTITELTLPASLKTIGESAFTDNQIKSLTIPNAVTYVGFRAFEDNPLETLDIPASLAARRTNTTGLFSEVFRQRDENGYGNKTLTHITMPANMDDSIFGYGGVGFEESFENFYKGQNKAVGTYVKNGPIWSRQ